MKNSFKEDIKELFNSKVISYLKYMTLMYIFYKIFGFELAIVIALGQIMSDIQEKK